MAAPGRLQINSVGRHKPKSISLLSFNANGLISSVDELAKCALEYKADIIMVQETHLKPKNSKSCKIKNFTLLRTDRQGAPMGGTAIYYNRALYCCPMDIPPLTNIEATAYDIDNAIGALTSHITTVVENSSRKVPAKSDRKELPRDVIELIRDKNAALRRAGKYPTRENRSRARALQRRVKARIKEIKTIMERPHGRNFTKSPSLLETRESSQNRRSPHPALKRPDNSIAFDDREKAECLADSIEHQCSENPPYDAEHVRRVEEEVRHRVSLPPKDGLDPITLDEVSKLIKGLKIRKSPGRDTISSKAIKCFSAPLVALLVAIFNACIQNCYFPTAWKEAVVIGIPKPGKPRDLPASYRPISLLSVLGKLFEKTLKKRLCEHLIGKGLIINEQFGFRPNHSCPQQALRLVEYISEGFKIKRKTVAVFFDVAKAFDRVWHAGLIHKLYQLELPDRLVIIIHHYISNRHFSFRLDNTYSSVRPIRAGVPQGSTLSPLLYSAYVNDIPRPSSGVQLALFADDTALYLRSNCLRNILPRLQRAIDELTQWLRLWRIEVNPEKSASIYFNYNTRRSTVPVPIDSPSLKILNQSIPWQHNYKYLGITLDKHLHFRDHVSRVRKLALFYLSRLYGMIGRK
ncbi:RNA-directed DNA polymerase from mobile element jockey [Eumeta japonica]|uniref:RNA-directed DNA polymerase from mobile element jockey n=1 Tax=Eumeta variegata TaxID=151549 RepID=A0A4C1Z8J7_EUMVA|nr:RNA-directed DNA polymerase from mobile element jockey [Eumeta japonica]